MNTSITSSSETAASSDQLAQVVRVIEDAARKGGKEVVEELAQAGIINTKNLQQVLGMKGFAASIREFVKTKIAELAENIRGLVKLISGAEKLWLDETDGKQIIAKAKDTFLGWIDPDFKEYGTNVVSEPTGKACVEVHEMIKNGTFAQIFGGMATDLKSLCLTQPQIIQFVQKYPKWLRTGGYGTFFLFKVGGEFFVAFVSWRGGERLAVLARRLSHAGEWNANDRRRLVVPQLVLTN